jgi:hypothetical protein
MRILHIRELHIRELRDKSAYGKRKMRCTHDKDLWKCGNIPKNEHLEDYL